MPAQAAPATALPPPSTGSRRRDEGFWVAVLPFGTAGAARPVAALAEGLTEDIVTGLSRFSYLRVSRAARLRVLGRGARRALGRPGAGRTLRNGGQRSPGGLDAARRGSARGRRLGAHLWAETYDRPFKPDTVFELQDDLVPRIVSTVADWYGVLPRSMSEAVSGKPAEELSPYEAVLRAFGYYSRVTPEEHATVRPILERAVAQAPGGAPAWAVLSMLYGEEHRFGFDALPDPLGGSTPGRSLERSRPRPRATSPTSPWPRPTTSGRSSMRSGAPRSEPSPSTPWTEPRSSTWPTCSPSPETGSGARAGREGEAAQPPPPGVVLGPSRSSTRIEEVITSARAPSPPRPSCRGSTTRTPSSRHSTASSASARRQPSTCGRCWPSGPTSRQSRATSSGGRYLPELVEQLIDGLRKAGLDVPPPAGAGLPDAADSDGRAAATAPSPALCAPLRLPWRSRCCRSRT